MATIAPIAAQMPPPVITIADAYRLGAPIHDQHGTIASSDGTSLFYRHWPAFGRSNHAVIVLHGIGFESGPYKVVAEGLNPRGIDVYGLDARGHGLSSGPRGYTGSAAQVADDVAAMVRFVKQQHRSSSIFLLGDSMGCNYALNFAKQHDDRLAGLILLAPAFYVDASQFFRLQSVLLGPHFLFAHRKPVIDLLDGRLTESTRDPQFVAERRADALAYKKVSFGYVLDIQRLIWNWRREIAPRVHAPILMIKGGQDRVVSQRDCETFARISASRELKFKLYPQVRHTTLWDPETPQILAQVGEWVRAH
jgi:alpha-beta hydrolase superfamily lysophospholipase